MEDKRLEQIKNKIIKLLPKNGLVINGIKNDCNGYLYCISNSIHKVYSIEIYKLGNTMNVLERMNNYNNSYFDKIKIHLLIKVSYKFMFETLLLLKLNDCRIKKEKEFFTNYDLIENEFREIKEILNNNDSLTSIEKYYEYVMNNKTYFRITKKIRLVNKIEYNLETKNSLDNYKNKLKNHIPNDKNNGYLLHLDIPEISHNFNSQIQVFTILSNVTTEFTEFVGNTKIKNKILIYDVKFAKYLLYDMLNNSNIKNKYFLCSDEKALEVVNEIIFYYDNYSCVEKIRKAYLFDKYQEGEKIPTDKKSTECFSIVKASIEEIKNTFTNKIDTIKKKIEYEENNFKYDSSIKFNTDSYDEIELYNQKLENKKNKLIEEVIIGRNQIKEKKANHNLKYQKKEMNKFVYDITKKSLPIKVDYTLDDFIYNKRQLKLKEILEEY
jgi:hypothetical protein